MDDQHHFVMIAITEKTLGCYNLVMPLSAIVLIVIVVVAGQILLSLNDFNSPLKYPCLHPLIFVALDGRNV